MKLVLEETLMGLGAKMSMIGTRETPDTTRMHQAIDQPGALMTEEILRGNNEKSLLKTNDMPSVVLGEAQAQWSFQSARRPR